MESFRRTDDADAYAIHTGFWTDWANGPVFGATITLNKRDGSLLIAFIALFVSIAGTGFWRICCFALHRFCSTQEAQDALYYQRQAIFRNAANSSSGLWGFLNIWWEWRRTAVDRPSKRLLPAVGFSLCCIGAFATAGMFSSKVFTVANGVLIRSPSCGILDIENNPKLDAAISYYYPWAAQIISTWAIYAQNCYLNLSDLGSCNAFVQPQLPAEINRNASCPFHDGICESEYGNISLDTYLDSHFDLGLNTPPHERIFFRRVTSCAPIKTDGYRSMHRSPETNMTYSRYYYGPTLGGNDTYEYTYEHPEVSLRSAPGIFEVGSTEGDRYTIQIRRALILNGSYTALSGYDPIPALRQEAADVYIFFLSANSILYSEKVNDPWYAATTNGTTISSTLHATGQFTTYRADKSVSVLACSIQEQYCNPDLPSGETCSPFGGTYESAGLADGLWNGGQRRAVFDWMSRIIRAFSVTIEAIPGDLRADALLATYKAQAAVSAGLPNDQWKLEVENWHAGTLAALQASVIQVAKGTTNENLKPFLSPPSNPEERNLCNSQKVPSGAHSNFSVFGVSFTLGLGSAIVCLSYALEPLTRRLQKRRSNSADYARLEWVTDETLQLQRRAYEHAGIGAWEGCASSVPVTRGGERLAALDLADADCPRLRVAPLRGVVVVEGSRVGSVGVGKDEERIDGGEEGIVQPDGAGVGDGCQSGDVGEGLPDSAVDVSSIQSG